MTSSNGNIFRVTGTLCGEFTSHRWISLTKASDAELWCFLLICAWTNGWVNNRGGGDLRLRRHHAAYDVILMFRRGGCSRLWSCVTWKYWNRNFFMLTKYSLLAALKVFKMTTFGTADDETFAILKLTCTRIQILACFLLSIINRKHSLWLAAIFTLYWANCS